MLTPSAIPPVGTPKGTKMITNRMTSKTVRIRTRVVKETFVDEGEISWERTTKSIVVTTMDEKQDLTLLHDQIVQALSK